MSLSVLRFVRIWTNAYLNVPKAERVRFTFFFFFEDWSFRNLLVWILSISMFVQKFIKMFHSVQEIGPFSIFQNLALGKASTDDKYHFAIVSLFQNLNLVKNSTNLKCHLTISWGTACQYKCVCKISSQKSTQFKR